MRAANQRDQDTFPPAGDQPPRLPDPSPRKQMFTALGAIAAVLLVTILAASLFAYFRSRQAGPASVGHAAGQITAFRVPTADGHPLGITGGPDGNLWSTEHPANRIGRITPTGQITEFPLPAANGYPVGITGGPDGNLWFTEEAGNIGRITPAGQITEFPLPTANSAPIAITSGSDGALWFTDAGSTKAGSDKIGRITP